MAKLTLAGVLTLGISFHISAILKKSDNPEVRATGQRMREVKPLSTVDFLLSKTSDPKLRQLVERLRNTSVSIPTKSVYPVPEQEGLLTIYRGDGQMWVRNENIPVDEQLQRALYVALLSQTQTGAHLTEANNPFYDSRKLHTINVPPEGFKMLDLIPVPKPYSERFLSAEQAIESSIEALYYFLESPRVPNSYKQWMKQLIKLKGVDFMIKLSFAVINSETYDGRQRTQLTRYEPRYGVSSHGYHQILATGPGEKTLRRLGLNPSDLNSPTLSALAFYVFLFEKGGADIVKIFNSVKNPSDPNDWRSFATFYNGPRYENNQYHKKLARYMSSEMVLGDNAPVMDDKLVEPNSPQQAAEQFLNILRANGVLSREEKVSACFVYRGQSVISINSQEMLPIASMVKIFVAWAYLKSHEIDPVKYPLSDDIKNQLKRMIRLSDNRATNEFMKKLGGPQGVQSVLRRTLPESIVSGVEINSYIPPGGAEYNNLASGSSIVGFMCYLLATQRESKASEGTLYLMTGSRERFGEIIQTEVSMNVEKTGTTGKTVGSVGVFWLDVGNGFEPLVCYVNCHSGNLHKPYNNPKVRQIRADLPACIATIAIHGLLSEKAQQEPIKVDERDRENLVSEKPSNRGEWKFFAGAASGFFVGWVMRALRRTKRARGLKRN